VSRQTYLARRVGAGVVAGALLLVAGFGVVQAIGALGGAGEDGSIASPTSVASASVSSAVASAAGPTAPTVAATTASTVTTAPPTPATTVAPSPSDVTPASVLIVGDSDAAAFAPFLRDQLDATGVATTTVDYKVSSGLARPDFYDWPAHLRETLPQIDPDIVVVTFGGNDAQGMSNADGSNPVAWNHPVAAEETWTPEYVRRAGEVMDLLAEDGRTVVWVGIPNDDSPEMSARLAVQDDAVRAALATRPHVQFVDTWKRFSSGNGGWAEYVVDPRDGLGKDVRADDGFHLNQNGAEILALDIAAVVTADLRDRGAAI
jgi:hypothetical protein